MCYVCLPVVSLQLYHDLSVFIMSPLAFHIDTTTLTGGTYELIPESDRGDPEVQVNAAELTEAPNQSSEEPRAEIVSNYREGKPRT